MAKTWAIYSSLLEGNLADGFRSREEAEEHVRRSGRDVVREGISVIPWIDSTEPAGR